MPYNQTRMKPYTHSRQVGAVTLNDLAATALMTRTIGSCGWRVFNPSTEDPIYIYCAPRGTAAPLADAIREGVVTYKVLPGEWCRDDGVTCVPYAVVEDAGDSITVYPEELF